MGILTGLELDKIYLDTNVFIYALEGFEEFSHFLLELLDAMDEGKLMGVTSELTLAEALVKPFEFGDAAKVQTYQEMLSPSHSLKLVPLDRSILIESARMRATYGIKLPDAIHATTAIHSGTRTFLTNDMRYKRIPELQVIILSEVI